MAARKKSTKTKSLDDITNFSSGKLDEDTLDRVKELEEVLGIKTINPFGTNDPKIFEKWTDRASEITPMPIFGSFTG